MSADNSGPAFPATSWDRGMTLRDYFAAKCLPMAWDYTRRIPADVDDEKADLQECRYAMYVDPDEGKDDCEFVAGLAYRMADAMLAERAK